MACVSRTWRRAIGSSSLICSPRPTEEGLVRPGCAPPGALDAKARKLGLQKRVSRKGDCFGPFEFRLTLVDGTTNWNCDGRAGLGDICKEAAGKYFLVVGAHRVDFEQNFDTLKETTRVVEG